MMTRISLIAVAATIAAAAFLHPVAVAAQTHSAGSLQIEKPWTRATPGGAKVGAGYLTVVNTGKETDRLIGAAADVATRVEIHMTIIEDGVARMRRVDGLEIKPGGKLELRPNGAHVMFMGLKQPFKQGEQVKGALIFEKAGKVDVVFVVQPIGGPPAAGHGEHGKPSGHDAHKAHDPHKGH